MRGVPRVTSSCPEMGASLHASGHHAGPKIGYRGIAALFAGLRCNALDRDVPSLPSGMGRPTRCYIAGT